MYFNLILFIISLWLNCYVIRSIKSMRFSYKMHKGTKKLFFFFFFSIFCLLIKLRQQFLVFQSPKNIFFEYAFSSKKEAHFPRFSHPPLNEDPFSRTLTASPPSGTAKEAAPLWRRSKQISKTRPDIENQLEVKIRENEKENTRKERKKDEIKEIHIKWKMLMMLMFEKGHLFSRGDEGSWLNGAN